MTQLLENHRHREVLHLPNGTDVFPRFFDADAPYARDQIPDFGLYFDPAWQPPWLHRHILWPDFGLPVADTELIKALVGALAKSRQGEQVELGCLGGHGRTGTALALLAILTGEPPENAIAWVRTHYCPKAIETPDQEAYVTNLAPLLSAIASSDA